MSEYIEREAVEQIIAAQCGECADACLEFDGIQPDCNQCLLCGAKKAIGFIPAADVRPVVRGRWEWDVLDGTPGYRPVVLCCSNCHRVSFSGWDFCPNCGADMRPEPPKEE